jgi:hypothetical protein
MIVVTGLLGFAALVDSRKTIAMPLREAQT